MKKNPGEDGTNVNSSQGALTEGKRKRRSKHEGDGRVFKCECGKAYLSQPALNNHKTTKHIIPSGAPVEKRGRGRPRKYPMDNEVGKFDNYFTILLRRKIEGENMNMSEIINSVYDDIYIKNYEKCYVHPKHYTDHPIFQMLFNETQVSSEKSSRKCDEIFYEYLRTVKDQTNKIYFILILKFIVLFRECFNLSKSSEQATLPADFNINGYATVNEPSTICSADSLPELCNEFISNFLEVKNYFGIESEADRNEIIELIQHFCYWLFKNEYTKSKLTLSSQDPEK